MCSNLFLFEFNLENLKHELRTRKFAIYKPYSIYPKISNDLSFIINHHITFNQIEMTIKNLRINILTNVLLLDE